VKHVIASIFSLSLGTFSVDAECKSLENTLGADTFWKYYSDEFGSAPFPGGFSVCTGGKYFQEIKGGAKMKSALDRQRLRILRRQERLQDLMHELAHIYLDMRWRILPYPVSEPLALAMAVPEKCDATKMTADELRTTWPKRNELDRCEMVNLIRNILRAPDDVRERLPAR
jgi:hypothetical protein